MDAQDLQKLKNKYDIIGNDAALNNALEMAVAVAPTDLLVLVAGESGVGKENIPKIIHQNSLRKTGKYFAVNCGAIPEGTIESELFGHEKGAFTGAVGERKGYFEEANGGIRQNFLGYSSPENTQESAHPKSTRLMYALLQLRTRIWLMPYHKVNSGPICSIESMVYK